MKLISRILLIASLSALVLSCKKEPAGGDVITNQEATLKISFSNYYNENGGTDSRAWEANDKVALINTAAPNKVYTSSPDTPGTISAMFSFDLEGAADGDNLMAYFPNSASVSYGSGKIAANIPASQTGTIDPVYIGKAKYSSDASRVTGLQLKPLHCTLYARIKAGNHSIKKAVLTSNAGENIAGNVALDYSSLTATASASAVTVEFSQALDCSVSRVIPFMVAPVVLSKGYTIKLTTDSGEEIEYWTEQRTNCTMGGYVESGYIGNGATQLLFCGDNHIYLVDSEVALTKGYKQALKWEWDALTVKETVGKNMKRLDDCKPVDNNTKILATSSQDYAVLIDYNTKKLLWYSNVSDNAHSAEWLPNNRIAVACSDGGDCIQIFDASTPNKVLFSTQLNSAHGVVWNPANECLYAVGGSTLNVYKLTDWNTTSPKLTLTNTISTKGGATSLHDLSLVDDNTLLLAGKNAAFYNISKGTFTKLKYFNATTTTGSGLKAVNYNPETKECWYTDATASGNDPSWSMDDIRYTSDVNKSAPTDGNWEKSIMVGDFIMYKVRVFKW